MIGDDRMSTRLVVQMLLLDAQQVRAKSRTFKIGISKTAIVSRISISYPYPMEEATSAVGYLGYSTVLSSEVYVDSAQNLKYRQKFMFQLEYSLCPFACVEISHSNEHYLCTENEGRKLSVLGFYLYAQRNGIFASRHRGIVSVPAGVCVCRMHTLLYERC